MNLKLTRSRGVLSICGLCGAGVYFLKGFRVLSNFRMWIAARGDFVVKSADIAVYLGANSRASLGIDTEDNFEST